MDPFNRDTSWASSPISPAPLALQDFMSQNALTASTHEDSVSRLDTTAAEAEVQSSTHHAGGLTTKPTPFVRELAIELDDQISHVQEPKAVEQDSQNQEREQDEDPIVDWKAIRVQIPQGKKSAQRSIWIRGWSEEIGTHGDATYCGCSAGAASSTSATDVAAISRISPPGSETQQPLPDDVGPKPPCPNCCRPLPPLADLRPGDEEYFGGRTNGLRKKMSGLVMRIIKGGKGLGPSPLRPGMASLLPEQQLAAKQEQGINDDGLVDPDDLSSSDGDGPRGAKGQSERQERLTRAQELLNRQRPYARFS